MVSTLPNDTNSSGKPPLDHSSIRVLVVAEHASAKFGGEAILPLNYFLFLREAGIEAWLLVHDRTRNELDKLLGADADRVRYIEDNSLNISCQWLTQPTERPIANITVNIDGLMPNAR